MSEKSAFPILDSSLVPRHVAIIMDGNGRWAKSRFLPRVAGHVKGLESVRKMVKACARRDIEFLTLFAFSSENWKRPTEEVSFLMELFVSSLKKEVDDLYANNIRLKVVGNLGGLNKKLQDAIGHAEQKTADNTRLTLTICANYGGQWDSMQAMKKLMEASPGQTAFSPEQIKPYLSMAYAPDPDLFIRTGGEQRISNFLLWQLAYTELYFTEMFWPDFDDEALDAAIASFRVRERRFGRTSEQLTA
jgi:undecaprenyl diphosphate synthase